MTRYLRLMPVTERAKVTACGSGLLCPCGQCSFDRSCPEVIDHKAGLESIATTERIHDSCR